MKKIIPALLFFLTFSGVSMAVTTMGAYPCGKWVKDRSNHDWAALADESKLAGYLSGIASASRKDFLRNTDSDSLFLWVDNYCQENPLDNLYDAGNKLSRELIRKNSL